MMQRLTRSSRAVGKLATFRSPVTGRLQVYTLTESIHASAPVTLDTVAAKNNLNSYFTTNGVDAICNDVKQISTGGIVSYVETTHWIPTAEIVGLDGRRQTLIDPVTLAFVIKAIIVIVGLLVVSYVVIPAIREFFDPHNFYGYDGTGPYTRSQAATYNAAHNPDKWVDPITTMVLDPSDPDFEAHKEFIINNTPSGWGIGIDWEQITNLLIIGGVVVIAVSVIPPIIGAFTRK